MKTLVSIKKALEFNSNLSFLIKTLKNIAVAQYKSLERKTKTFKDIFFALESFFEFVDASKINHRFLSPGGKPQLVVAVTSDKGLLGGLNMRIIGSALRELEKHAGRLVIIGECGKIYASASGVSKVFFPGIRDKESHSQALQLRDYLESQVLSGLFGYIKVVYPRPVSFTVQHVVIAQVLPFTPVEKSIDSLSPGQLDIIWESSAKDVVEYLIHLWMGQKLDDIFGLSRLAEFAARYIHLEESAEKLKEIDKKNKQEYFRVRHELVDRTMRELFAGRLIYAK